MDCDTLSENYDRLHQKSQEIIQKLQNERDGKILECEKLKKHVRKNNSLSSKRLWGHVCGLGLDRSQNGTAQVAGCW